MAAVLHCIRYRGVTVCPTIASIYFVWGVADSVLVSLGWTVSGGYLMIKLRNTI